jgi:hypothetical protein
MGVAPEHIQAIYLYYTPGTICSLRLKATSIKMRGQLGLFGEGLPSGLFMG